MTTSLIPDPQGSKADASPPPATKVSSFLKAVGEYKELAAVIATVIGVTLGVTLLAFAYFATKQQLKEIKCITDANIAMIQGRIDSSAFGQLLMENQKEIAPLERKTDLTQDEILKRSQLALAANALARKIADADSFTAQALNKLRSGECIGN